ncbi:MAG: c-type cytochrome, partial [Ghiorsea sp.]|nr:c-type cytochrome [Ghiorsea sp.]
MMYKLVMLLVVLGLVSCNQNTAPQQPETTPAQTETKAISVDNMVAVQEPEAVNSSEIKPKPKLAPQATVPLKEDKKVEPAKVTVTTTVEPVLEKMVVAQEKVVEHPKHVEITPKKVIAPLVQGKQPLRSEPVAQSEPVMAVGDAVKGKKIAKKCMSCHTFKQGGKKKTGPNLFAIVGREKGSVSGFKYGSYLKGVGGVWSETELRAWLLD